LKQAQKQIYATIQELERTQGGYITVGADRADSDGVEAFYVGLFDDLLHLMEFMMTGVCTWKDRPNQVEKGPHFSVISLQDETGRIWGTSQVQLLEVPLQGKEDTNSAKYKVLSLTGINLYQGELPVSKEKEMPKKEEVEVPKNAFKKTEPVVSPAPKVDLPKNTFRTDAVKETVDAPKSKEGNVDKKEEKEKKGVAVTLMVVISSLAVVIFGVAMWYMFLPESFAHVAKSVGIKLGKEEVLVQEEMVATEEASVEELEYLEAEAEMEADMSAEAMAQEVEKEAVVVEETSIEQSPVEETPVQPVNAVGAKRYYLVGGSFGVEANAQKLYKQLQEKGYEALIIPYKNMHTVAYGVYDNIGEAKQMMENIRQRENKQVWILKY